MTKKMIKLRHIFVLGTLLILSGCKLEILDPKGIIALAEKNLLIDAVLLMLIVVIPVIILSFVIPWRYSQKNAKYSPNWSDSTLLEVIWWGIPCIIIAILATITWISTHQLDPYRPLDSQQKPIVIEAVALDWKWLFIYPEQHIATVNYVQIPTNVPVQFYITADAPMNSLEIPQLAGQIYAMPGMRTKLNLMATQEGSYYGLSTNFSGDGFSGMNFTVKATSPSEFNQWIHHTQQSPKKLTSEQYDKLAKASENNPPEFFSEPSKDLFHTIIMKYMGPDMKMNKNN